MATVRYFWHGFIHRATTSMCPQYSHSPWCIIFCQMFGRHRTSLAHQFLLIFCIDCPIAWISSSQSPAMVLSHWQRDRNCMDSYRANMVDVSVSPIVSGTRGPCQQQQCDSLHCHVSFSHECRMKVVCLGGTEWCRITPSMSYTSMNIIFTAYCVGHTFFGWRELDCFHSFDWHFKFGSYEHAQVSSIVTIRPRKLSPSL